MPTALQLSREGWKPYLEAARRRPAAAPVTEVDEQQRRWLLDRARQVADLLKRRFGAQRVLLFGSLAHAAWFMPDSDVDLVVEGIAPDRYWEAWRVAEEVIPDRPVDLIDMATATAPLRQAIERYGIPL